MAVWLAEDGVTQMRAFYEFQFGALRKIVVVRERQGALSVAESLVALYRVGTHQIRRGRRAAQSSTSKGSTKPLCARTKSADQERFLRE